jgi:hypothetical protein
MARVFVYQTFKPYLRKDIKNPFQKIPDCGQTFQTLFLKKTLRRFEKFSRFMTNLQTLYPVYCYTSDMGYIFLYPPISAARGGAVSQYY